jgi:transcription elongation GreA/GreB family factor
MNFPDLKKDLFQSCLAEIDQKADTLRNAMDEAQQSANDYGPPKDRYDSYRTQLLRKRDLFGQQLQKIMEQRNLLEKTDPEKASERVEFGALVITDAQKIFVSVGLGRHFCNDMEFFVISPAVPFYKAMEGKRAGDVFDFRGERIRILQIL